MTDERKKRRQPNKGSFKKGQPSANPKGRGKGKKPKNAITQALDQPVYVTLDGKRKKLTAREAAAYRMAADAVKGDKAAFKMLMAMESAARDVQAAETALAANYPPNEDDLKTIEGICHRIRSTPSSDAPQ